MHCFRVPARLRADSDGQLQTHHNRPTQTQQESATEVVNPSTGVGAILNHQARMVDSVSARAVYNHNSHIVMPTNFSSDTASGVTTPRSAQNSSNNHQVRFQ